MDNLPIQTINPRKSIIIKGGKVVLRKRERNNTHLIFQKINITIFLVMVPSLLAIKGRKFYGNLQGQFQKIKSPTYEGKMNTGDKDEERLLGIIK